MLTRGFLTLINIYQKHLRLIVPRSCRFHPTCSEFAKEAIVKYGLYKGALKTARRILICHPFSGRSGYNPVD